MLSASAASIILPVPKFVLSAPEIVIPEFPIILGSVREIMEYEPRTDLCIFNIDAFNGREQISVCFRGHINENNREESKKNYLISRQRAQQVLRDRLIKEKWDISEMIRLPIHSGLYVPDWLRA